MSAERRNDLSRPLRYVADTGQVIEMKASRFKPLSYDSVVQGQDDHHIEFAGELTRAEDRSGLPLPATVSADITFRNPASIYALVEGGWLPLPFVAPRILLVDRNVIVALARIADGSLRQDICHTRWWITFLEDPRFTINPVLYAWEGASQRTPTYREFCDALDEGCRQIAVVLRKASILELKDVHREAAYTSILQFGERLRKETQFLLQAAPLISNRASDANLREYRQVLANRARELGLNNRSLAVIAAFSCLFELHDGSGYLLGRRIIKPKAGYSEQDAYNALSDLRNLELFVCSHALPEGPISLCTCDRALVAFWCLINPHSILHENGKFTYSLTFDQRLFPRLSQEELEAFLKVDLELTDVGATHRDPCFAIPK